MCDHDGYHGVTSSYDRGAQVLRYFSFCERCGAPIAEIEQLKYAPRFRPPEEAARLERALRRPSLFVREQPMWDRNAGSGAGG